MPNSVFTHENIGRPGIDALVGILRRADDEDVAVDRHRGAESQASSGHVMGVELGLLYPTAAVPGVNVNHSTDAAIEIGNHVALLEAMRGRDRVIGDADDARATAVEIDAFDKPMLVAGAQRRE